MESVCGGDIVSSTTTSGPDPDHDPAATVDGANSPSNGGAKVGGVSEDRVKGPWSPEEDAILSRLVSKFGARNWSLIARGIPGRSGKSCRLRWCNQLDPCVKRKPFTGAALGCVRQLKVAPLRGFRGFVRFELVEVVGGGVSILSK
ncbi:hypothetical protein Sjap_013391 [Stephania japonica]|uniref:Uncharacterized protein n=1 Tax=Stephania japonica TaxID=461633 RepID=A0AAP0NZ32_9MAGN